MTAVEKSALGEFRLYWLWAPDSTGEYKLKLRLKICDIETVRHFLRIDEVAGSSSS